jgi:hypothetical protein
MGRMIRPSGIAGIQVHDVYHLVDGIWTDAIASSFVITGIGLRMHREHMIK